jgi:hypothetical protein
MRSLGRLTRGLSALFWGLPLALLLSVQTASTNWLGILGPFSGAAPVVAFGLLQYGLWLTRDFQKQERIWIRALDQAQLFGIVNIGLAPFLHWHQRLPEEPLFASASLFLGISSGLFLFCLNRVLQRLAAMLPDETLRFETAAFTYMNRWLILLVPGLVAGLALLLRSGWLPPLARLTILQLAPFQHLVLLFLALLPLAITMSLTWKIKEAILTCVFDDVP